MTLQQLRYVTMVAETGTITEAANRLYISQPSLTNAIHELEKEMNIVIFNRTNKGISLSREGEDFLGFGFMGLAILFFKRLSNHPINRVRVMGSVMALMAVGVLFGIFAYLRQAEKDYRRGIYAESDSYFAKAVSKSKGIQKMLVGKAATEDTINGWDSVSGATRTSKAVKEAALAAIKSANEAVTVDTTKLEAAITAAEALKEADYTADSWSAMQTKLTAAKAALTAKESQSVSIAAR